MVTEKLISFVVVVIVWTSQRRDLLRFSRRNTTGITNNHSDKFCLKGNQSSFKIPSWMDWTKINSDKSKVRTKDFLLSFQILQPLHHRGVCVLCLYEVFTNPTNLY